MTDVLERELRAAMDEGSEFLQVPAGTALRAWAAAQQRVAAQAPPPRPPFWSTLRSRFGQPRRRTLAFGGVGLVIALVAGIIALGGSGSAGRLHNQASAVRAAHGSGGSLTYGKYAPVQKHAANSPAFSSTGSSPLPSQGQGAIGTGAAAPNYQVGTGRQPLKATPKTNASAGDDGTASTRIVKTGSLSLTVEKGEVGKTITALTSLTTRLGGYVAQSRTDTEGGSPTGSLTFRIPANNFETAISQATALGHETSLSTSAHDVTGKYVDLGAKEAALKHTRATYLTILSRARTIGQTLSVQQRVNDIQEQINSLEGQLKVLRNQSNDGTLTVDVSQAGSLTPNIAKPHHRSGFSKAWHTSTHRFNRGVQAIIGALGPLLLALILLGIVVFVGWSAVRIGRRRGAAGAASTEV